ncbi:Serine hydrolase [Halomicronema hongdechloris C2206]|uniref:Serine hydrolase n=1 Tax=Halomicronema hongdechloris C2206 TaxID=1641165 RepID=A0A1Z3HR48_9CYAN|nr:serine hydrolase [Halomicronema hongdechloris]ASC72799.1 Serine hydrolase [Halomicronema hongdechloris C2206]
MVWVGSESRWVAKAGIGGLVLAACYPLVLRAMSLAPSSHVQTRDLPQSLGPAETGLAPVRLISLPGTTQMAIAADPLSPAIQWWRPPSDTLARDAYGLARRLAAQAVAMQVGRGNGQFVWQRQAFLWRAAIAQLQTIPPTSPLATLASHEQRLYATRLAAVTARLEAVEADVLGQIAGRLGSPRIVRISVCPLMGTCRHHQGQVPPASPASLIKMPIAFVLLQQVAATASDLGDSIYIDPHNFTENGAQARIFVDRHYSLGQVMARMIDESNNIATNQLIDYLGWATLNLALQQQGFATIQVRTKLVGAETSPTQNMGWAANTLTTAELTDLMRSVYARRVPGAEHLIRALATQTHRDFGYEALRAFPAQRVAWLGEKTGQNSQVIGSTLAVRVDGQVYLLTVTLDRSGNQRRLRQILRDVVSYLLYREPLLGSPLAQGS